MEAKAELRKRMLRARNQIPAEKHKDLTDRVFHRIIDLPEIRTAKAVYVYASVRGELGTDRLIRHFLREGIPTALPRVEGREMAFYYIEKTADLEMGSFGIPEPSAGCRAACAADAAVLTPGLAFTPSGARLGYGGGYYDRFFARERGHTTIGICFDEQVTGEIPTEATDVVMDLVVTPSGIYGQRT